MMNDKPGSSFGLLAALLVLFVAGCNESPSDPQNSIYSGKVESLQAVGIPADGFKLLIVTDRHDCDGRFALSLGAATKVFDRAGNSIGASDIAIGDRVRAEIYTAIDHTCPLQAGASRIDVIG